MSFSVKHNINSLAKSLTPGVAALVGAELEYIIDDALAHARKELIGRIAHRVEVSVDDALHKFETDVHVKVDCVIKDKL